MYLLVYVAELELVLELNPCQVPSALLAFCWLGWIALIVLLVITSIFVIINKTWTEPLHGNQDPRQNTYA
ncbi:hypothetical protein BKA70DRAFT_1121924 [Coprinopsis sp. MPI-PUGE-AT-0042]|nr:hypothetical protein BKA70DRAFT_1121924 [Coprinopsis sp. MPI-PUGE-AT-0042]